MLFTSFLTFLVLGLSFASAAVIPVSSDNHDRGIQIHSDGDSGVGSRPTKKPPGVYLDNPWTGMRTKPPPAEDSHRIYGTDSRVSSQYLQHRKIHWPTPGGVRKMSDEGGYRVGYKSTNRSGRD